MNSRKKKWLMAVTVMMLTGCYNYDEEPTQVGEPVKVELAYTVSSSDSGNKTRQADALVQNSHHLLPSSSSLRIVALADQVPATSRVFWDDPVSKEDPKSGFYHSISCEMNLGVNGCFVYGPVDPVPSGGVDSKVYNGSLIAKNASNNPVNISTTPINDQDDLLGLTFSLESMWDNIEHGVPTGATTVAGYLTAVANVSVGEGTKIYWKNSKNEILKNLFVNFTNHENNLPGSAAAVKKWLELLKDKADEYYNSTLSSLGTTERNILQAISAEAQNQIDAIGEIDNTSYPRNIHLPDGAAVLRWVRSTTLGDAFQPRLENTTIDNINGISRFAYPAALYYFVDGSLKTSNSKVESYTTNFDGVTSDVSKTAWDKVLEEFTDGSSVRGSTKSVVIVEPVQYAVAQLQVTVKSATQELEDATTPTAKSVNIVHPVNGTNSFPLTGVIVSGQRPVNCMFEPVSSEVDTKFIYDSQVKNPGTTPDDPSDDTYYYMTTVDPNGAGPCTLVLQSAMTEDINIILEFENNSDQDFEGVNGTVYRGTRFYLIGRVPAPLESQYISSDEKTKQVFTKDYITTVNMTVSSLAKAYSVLPSLLKNNLEIGVEATPQWVAATPTVIRLE